MITLDKIWKQKSELSIQYLQTLLCRSRYWMDSSWNQFTWKTQLDYQLNFPLQFDGILEKMKYELDSLNRTSMSLAMSKWERWIR